MLLEQDLVPPRVMHPSADRDLELIALSACRSHPTCYISADALANDLEAYLKDEPIAARSSPSRKCWLSYSERTTPRCWRTGASCGCGTAWCCLWPAC